MPVTTRQQLRNQEKDTDKNDTIKKFIAIRPEIKDFLMNSHEIDESKIEVIYNPIDETKFTKKETEEKNYVLFVGTIDYLRKETILELSDYTKENGMELWLVGEDKSNYLGFVLYEPHVKHFPATWNIEKFIHECKETAGIQLGRTTIEGWMCGKPGWIFNVNSNGFVISKEKFDPPADIEKYHSTNVASKIKDEYIKIIS